MANWSKNALELLGRRYLARDEDGKTIETPEDMVNRVVVNIVEAQGVKEWGPDYFEIIDRLDFLPNSPTLMNAGRPLQQLSACFAWKVPDSLEGIFSSIEKMAVVQKSGGGTGFWFGDIREEGSMIKSTMHMKASGPVDYMPLFDHATEVVQQGGMRRGASIAVLPVWHPDIKQFIKMKSEEGTLANFNISVAIDNKFMEALKNSEHYPLISPVTNKQVGAVDARDLWSLISESIWKNGEPGVLYWDRIQKEGDEIGLPIIGVNPCGEQVLPNYGSCNLGSINLSHYKDDEWLHRVTEIAVRFLNGVIDANKLPLPEIDEVSKKYRQIGLGVMGWADLLLQKGIKYGSKESLKLAEQIMSVIRDRAKIESIKLIDKYGSCPATDGKRANATLLTIAPTGSISILADCSSSIEPIWDTKYASYVLPDKNYEEASNRGELIKIERDYESISDDNPAFITAMQVHPKQHIIMQAVFQKYVDSAVSKTINMAENVTVSDIRMALVDGYMEGCKGLTIYRDKSRKVQVVRSTSKSNISEDIKGDTLLECDKEKITKEDTASEGKRPMKRPVVLEGKTHKVQTGCGSLYAVINKTDDGRIREVFLRGGKSGGCSSTFLETAGRLITLALRADVPAASVIKQIKYCRCSMPSLQSKSFSCMDAIGKLLEVESGQIVEQENGDESCPNCDDKLRPASGCWECPSCGYSRCN